MAYDQQLAERIRALVSDEPGVAEQKMFGGLAFFINGNMAVAASGKGGLLARVDPALTDSLLALPGVSIMEMRGRGMRGWLRVAAETVTTHDQLAQWVQRSVAYANALPHKTH